MKPLAVQAQSRRMAGVVRTRRSGSLGDRRGSMTQGWGTVKKSGGETWQDHERCCCTGARCDEQTQRLRKSDQTGSTKWGWS